MSIQLTASIGVAQYPIHARSAIALMRKAESAMFTAKALDEVSWSQYDESLRESQEMASKLADDLRDAIAQNDLYLLYQPIIDLQDRTISGVEACCVGNTPP